MGLQVSLSLGCHLLAGGLELRDTDQPDTEVNHDSWGWGTICLGTNEHELTLAVGSKCSEQRPRAGRATHLYLSLTHGGRSHDSRGGSLPHAQSPSPNSGSEAVSSPGVR